MSSIRPYGPYILLILLFVGPLFGFSLIDNVSGSGDHGTGTISFGRFLMAIQVACIGLSQISVSAAHYPWQSSPRNSRFKGWDPGLDARVVADRYKIFQPGYQETAGSVRDASWCFYRLPSDEVLPTLKVLDVAMGRDLVMINISPMHAQTQAFIVRCSARKFLSFPFFRRCGLKQWKIACSVPEQRVRICLKKA